MSWPRRTDSTHPNAGNNTARAAAVVLGSTRMLTSEEVAAALGLRPDTAQLHLRLCRKANRVVLVGGYLWASPEAGHAARAEIHAAAKERRRLVNLKKAAAKRSLRDLTFKQEFRASKGMPVQRTRTARAGDAVALGPNSVFALGAAVQA